MWKPLALVACCAVVGVPVALADESNPTLAASVAPSSPSCTPMKDLYSHRRWREPHPLRGRSPCRNPNAGKLKKAFFLYRHYRRVATYRGFNEGDPWLEWLSVPAYIVSCETNGYRGEGRWLARNSSGAQGPAQLLGWPAPNPARTPREKVRYWEVTAQVWHGSGAGAWACA